MPWRDTRRRAWAVLTLFFVLSAGASAQDAYPPLSMPTETVEPTAAAAAPAEDADSLFRRALDLERHRDWSAAIKLYEDGLERWPGRVDFVHRKRLCETHYRLGRRYQDSSFRDVLLRMPRDQALDLFDEILERIESQYVEDVPLEPLLRGGFDNMEVALRDPVFLEAHVAGVPRERVKWLRDQMLDRRRSVTARSRAEARAHVLAACELARQAVGIGEAPIVLEFAYGACDSLDDYSSYLTPDRLDDLYAMIDGNFVGLGVELKLDPAGLLLVNVLKGGPASESGLHPGDRVTHIDGTAVRGLDLDAAANRLQGPEGSQVTVTVLRIDGSKVDVRLRRRPVEVQSVAEAKMVDSASGIAYIQLTGFQKTSTTEIQQAIAGLQRQGMRSLVLDLRGNPGGLLNIAVEIADRFLDSGVIVTTRGRAPDQSAVYRDSQPALWRMPLMVLVDGDSASASEILAGALQDHRRATILGERSYGKGSVQSIFPLRSAPAGLKLTTAKFFSPQDRAYSEQGVTPDVGVRTAARPAAGESRPELVPSASFGNPDRDEVLRAAIRLIQGRGRRQAG